MPPERDDVAAHIPRLYRVALRILGNHHTAEEVVQEACVRALEQRNGFQQQSTLTTWLHRITVNCAVDRLRRENLRDRGRVDCDVASVVGDHQPTPEQVVERQELSQIAASLMRDLPEEFRAAFVLTQLDGYTYDEAAQIEGKQRGTIASRVARAKSLLLAAMTRATTSESDLRASLKKP